MNPTGRNRQVVITGIGMITCLGATTKACWEALLSGKSGIRQVARFDTKDSPVRIGGELTDDYFELEKSAFPKRLRSQTLSSTRLAMLCARAAIEDAQFKPPPEEAARVAVVTGCSQPTYQESVTNGTMDLSNYVVLKQMVNANPAWISIQNGFQGPTFNVATACASGAFAISMALDLIRAGRCDAAVVVGLDLLLNYESLMGFSSLMALANNNDHPAQAACPFDQRRTGFVMANGGCGLVFETAESARRRSARVYAELAGYGMCSEAHNIVAPEPSGAHMARSMQLALDDAGLAPADVGYISAHGTSTIQNDAAESAAIRKVFGDHAKKLAVSSQKSMTGHTIGGAGAIECGATALCLQNRVLTPTINYHEPDPACDLDYVPNTARSAPDVRAALSNSFGFGGHNASLALKRWDM
jgi:3-oxoacyl-[acyl-carrier-protein] synthase II